MRKLSGVIVLMVFAALSYAQTLKQLDKAGDNAFTANDFYAASQYYNSALAKDEENIDIRYKYAESLRMFNDYKNAAEAYSLVAKADKGMVQYPTAVFWYGTMLHYLGKYDEAVKHFTKFTAKYKKKDYYLEKATHEIESCNWAKANLKPTQIKVEHLGKDVNTEKSEFNAVHVDADKIQFSALRNISKEEKKEKYLVRIYNQPPTPNDIFNPQGANQEKHIGNLAYSPDIKELYFTECEGTEKVPGACKIFVSKYNGFVWDAAIELSDKVNVAGYSSTHPALGFDKHGNKVLYFASDRPGGMGKMDLWNIRINDDGTMGNPINMGKEINTADNEVTPFYDFNNNKLYFSSEWHNGFGGFDIFVTEGEGASWTKPVNLMQPINTSQNDLYYSMAFDKSKAYITSNRKGSLFIEAETCCNDIYAYETGEKIIIKRVDTPVVKMDTPVLITKIDTPVTPEVVLKEIPKDTLPVVLNTPPNKEPIEPVKYIDDKIKQVKQMLPVALYFHNDEPECCNLRDTTALDYKQTYEAYYALLGEYKKEYAKGLKEGKKMEAEQAIFYLFTNRVDKGYYDLVQFTSQLLEILKAGNKVELTVKGYCSPLNYNIYNIKLGYRRIASVRNYFYHYRDGLLMPYIANGSLVLKNESMGEETAAKAVSDSREDTRNSVYNPDAAKERRVEIISIEIK
jgi:hypothetical protein